MSRCLRSWCFGLKFSLDRPAEGAIVAQSTTFVLDMVILSCAETARYAGPFVYFSFNLGSERNSPIHRTVNCCLTLYFPISFMAAKDVSRLASPSYSMEFGIVAETSKDGLLQLDIREHSDLAWLTSYFESIEVVAAEASIAVPPATSGYVACGFLGGKATGEGSIQDFTKADGFSHSYLAKNDPKTILSTLNADHRFGREVGFTSLGNLPPVLRVFVKGLPSTNTLPIVALVKYYVAVRGRSK